MKVMKLCGDGRIMVSLIAFFTLVGCASSSDRKIEEARFLLDEGKFEEAEVKAREAVAENPTSVEAQFLLASTLIGVSFLGDESYLEKLATVQESSGAANKFTIFNDILPSELPSEKLALLYESRDILIDIPDSAKTKDIWLQQYMARLFEIASVSSVIGATSDDACASASYNPSGLSADQLSRFQDNLDNINSDGDMAGLPDDFSLDEAFVEISMQLTAAIISAGNEVQGTADFFNTQFGCVTP